MLGELVGAPEVAEAAAISTCNRTELYLYASDPVDAESQALTVLAREAEIRPTELVSHLYSLRGADAAEQLFRVTAGLDSMIVGEAEIQGQVKRAYELALVEDATGPVLNRLFRGALAAGKRARTETAISEGALSVPQVAVELAQRTLGDLEARTRPRDRRGRDGRADGAGAGGAGRRRDLHRQPPLRPGDRPRRALRRRAVRFEELPALLVDADIVVSSTSSPHHVIERDALDAVMTERESRPLLLIDLAVPRDIHPPAAS